MDYVVSVGGVSKIANFKYKKEAYVIKPKVYKCFNCTINSRIIVASLELIKGIEVRPQYVFYYAWLCGRYKTFTKKK